MTGPEDPAPPAGVGFVGLGQIGRPMALRLAGAPGGLWVYDVAPAATAPLAEAGAEVAGSVAELTQHAGVICLMVRDDEQVRSVCGEILAAARPGTVVVVHSTIHPQTAVELAGVAAGVGVHVLDAPVSGGPMGAESGRLAVMVGGDPDGFELARPVLERLGDLVVHLGPVGAGTHAKLARNLLHFAAFTAVAEAQRLAEAAGVSPEALGRVVRHSDAVTGGPGAIMWRDTAAPMAADDPWRPIFTHVADLGEKDLRLALELAGRLGVETPLAELALRGLRPGLGLTVPDREGNP